VETKEQYKNRVAHLEDDLHNLEAYMEDFTSFLPVAVCIASTDSVIVDTNEAFSKFVGHENKEAIGMKLDEIFTDPAKFRKLRQAVDEGPGSPQSTRLTLQKKSGDEQSVRLTIGIRRDIDSENSGYFIGIAPVPESQPSAPPAPTAIETDLAKKTAQLEGELSNEQKKELHQQQKNQAILNGLQNAIIVLDKDNNIDTVNDHAAEILSVDQGEVCGQSLDMLRERDDLQALITRIDSGSSDESDKFKIGEQAFDISTQPITTADGTTYQLITLHDVSRDEFIEEMKMTFVTVAAHQIRTPLAAIRWSLEILVQQLEDEEQKQIARRGYRSAQNILEIVNEILNLDRLESGQDGYSFAPIDIIELLDGYVEEVEANNRIIEQADIIYNRPVDPLPKVRADREKLRIVLRNLIDNALKYTDSDGSIEIESSVHVSNDYSNDMIQISISDSGIGIPAADQDKIFSKFYRADNATSVKTEGTGIGLYISKQIVDLHDGTIWFESEEDSGTTFFIRLPIA
jgi:two-component system sensor histidine kinase VicK